MKKIAILLALFIALTIGACTASANSAARDAMIAYSGTEAFTKLTPEERQACVSWLVNGGTMNRECRRAAMRLVVEEPDSVTPEQRQALLDEASEGARVSTARRTPAPVKNDPPVVKKDESDPTGTIIAVGIIGLIAGMIIHNNVGGSRHREPPAYRPGPPPPHRYPGGYRRPPQPVRVPPRSMPPRRPPCR